MCDCMTEVCVCAYCGVGVVGVRRGRKLVVGGSVTSCVTPGINFLSVTSLAKAGKSLYRGKEHYPFCTCQSAF